MNVQNMTLKLQAVAEKTANNFRGLLFAAPGTSPEGHHLQ